MKRAALLILIIQLTCSVALAQNGVNPAKNKPNILWITIEDTSPQFVGCYGDTNARTPQIDKLARQGVRFTNAFSTGTVCSPSRSTIITGIRTFEMGTGNHRSTYPLPDFVHGFPHFMREAGYYTTNNSKTDYNIRNPEAFIKDAWNESSNKAGWWNRQPGQPFFAVFNFMDSHQSRTMTDSYKKYTEEVLDQLPDSDKIKENAFTMPPFLMDNPAMRKQFARVYNSIKLTDNRIGELLARLDKDHLRDSTIIFFFADHGEGIPRGKTNGINLGYRVPFVIWFPPMCKNLSPWGAGMVTDELVDFEDLAPTLISMAGGTVPDYLRGRILAGAKRSAAVNHIELSSDRSDNGIDVVRSISNGRYVYSRNYMPFMPEVRYIRYAEISDIKQQMRSDLAAGKLDTLQKRIFEDRPDEFLFDIQTDKWETDNLACDSRFSNLLDTMRQQLRADILRRRDVMFLPEYEIAHLSAKTTPYEYRLKDENYPLAQIYDAASISGQRGLSVARRQLELLKDTNNVVRFWAITGIRAQHADILNLYREQILGAMRDRYAPVVITASAIAYQHFNDQQSLLNLKRYCLSDNKELALLAINYVLYLTDKQPFIDVIRKEHDKPDIGYDVKAACMDFLGILHLVPNNPDYEK
jgi:arylsulfatase A-like enzyme